MRVGCRHVGDDLGERPLLTRVSARRAALRSLAAAVAGGAERAAGQALLMRPHQGDGELVGEQLVEGEALARAARSAADRRRSRAHAPPPSAVAP